VCVSGCCYAAVTGRSRHRTIFLLAKIEEEGLEKALDAFEGKVLAESNEWGEM